MKTLKEYLDDNHSANSILESAEISNFSSVQDGITSIKELVKYVEDHLGCSIRDVMMTKDNLYEDVVVAPMEVKTTYDIPMLGYYWLHPYVNTMDMSLVFIEFDASTSESYRGSIKLFNKNRKNDIALLSEGSYYNASLYTLYNLLKDSPENKLVKLAEDLAKETFANGDPSRKKYNDNEDYLGRFLYAIINVIADDNNYTKLKDIMPDVDHHWKSMSTDRLINQFNDNKDKKQELVSDDYFRNLLKKYL